MAGFAIEQILGYVYLTGLIEAVKSGVPELLPPAFWSTKTETLYDQGRYVQYSGTRRVSRRAEYGAASHRRELNPIGTKDVKLAHFFEHVDIDVKVYQSLRAYTDYKVQQKGKEELARQAKLFRTYFDNNRIAMVQSMLAKGTISWNSDGLLLPSTSGAAYTVDYGIPANNQNQLNGIIAASWALSSTNIPAHLRSLKKQARKDTGYPLKYAFYGENIPTYLTNNDYVLDYLSRSPAISKDFLETSEVPDGLFGLTWVPMYEAFFDASWGESAADNQSWWGADTVVFAPEINSEVYELMEGTYNVPTTFSPLASLEQTANSFDLKTGMFAYGVPIHDPMTARFYAGDTVLPIWKVPSALYIADVTP